MLSHLDWWDSVSRFSTSESAFQGRFNSSLEVDHVHTLLFEVATQSIVINHRRDHREIFGLGLWYVEVKAELHERHLMMVSLTRTYGQGQPILRF